MAKSFSSLGQNPYSFSKDKIISVHEENNNLIGITEGGNSKHLGGVGGEIRSISNSNNHAIIIDTDGVKTLFNFSTKEMKQI